MELPASMKDKRKKLTAQQVKEIRELRKLGGTLKGIAEAYGVSTTLVIKIANNKIWKEEEAE